MKNGDTENRSFGDIDLIESMLNDGEISAVNRTKQNMTKNMKYNAFISYNSTIGIYMPIPLEFEPYEIQLLEMLAKYIKQTSLNKFHFQNLILIVSHFFSKFLITIETETETKTKTICFGNNKVSPYKKGENCLINETTYTQTTNNLSDMKTFFDQRKNINIDDNTVITIISYLKTQFISKKDTHKKVLLALIPEQNGGRRRFLRMKKILYK